MGYEKRDDGWWVTGQEPYTYETGNGERVESRDWGPYETKAAAEKDLKGVRKTLAKWKDEA